MDEEPDEESSESSSSDFSAGVDARKAIADLRLVFESQCTKDVFRCKDFDMVGRFSGVGNKAGRQHLKDLAWSCNLVADIEPTGNKTFRATVTGKPKDIVTFADMAEIASERK